MINKAITINGDGKAIISYGTSNPTVTFTAAATLANFKIMCAHNTGVRFNSTSTGATIQNCDLSVYTYGKGIEIAPDGLNSVATVNVLSNIISGGGWKSEGFYGCIVSYGGSSIIANNLIKDGARGIQLYGTGTPHILGNTIVNNNNYHSGSQTKGGALYVSSGLNTTCAPYIYNNIIANNTATWGGAYYIDIFAHGSVTDMSYNTFYGNVGTAGVNYAYYPQQADWTTIGVDGNTEENPLFLGTNDYRLQTTSPCIGTGSNTYVAGTTDVAGLPRTLPTGGTVDRGCYEGASALTNTRTVGDWVELRGKPVTGNFGDMFYIEEPNRVYGVKVAATSSVAAGDLVTVDGQYAMVDNELTLQPSAMTSATGSSSNIPGSLGMNNKALGGINIGLLVRVWGKITTAAAGVYTIDDGSGLDITVLWYGTPYSVNDYIAVTGVSCYGCVRATSVDYITTIEEQLLRMENSSMSLAVDTDRTQQKLQGLLTWREFVVAQLDKINSKRSLTASEQNWKELWEMMLSSLDKQIADLR